MELRNVEPYKKNKNTGKAIVEYNPAITKGGFFMPKGDVLTAAELADLKNSIHSRLINDDPSKRWHLVGPFESFDDKSQAAQSQTLGYGREVMLDKGVMAYEYTYLKGGMAYHLAIMDYDGKQAEYDWLPFDANNVIRGTKGVDNTGSLALAGLSLSQIFVYPVKDANRTTVAEYRIKLAFDSVEELNQNAFIVNADDDEDNPYDIAADSELYGVRDLVITNITQVGAATGVYTFAVTTANGDLNIAASSIASLLAATGAWGAINPAGAAITVSSVAVNGAKNGFTVTLDHTDADYTVGQKLFVNFKAISVLAGLGVKYYDCEGITVTAS